MQWDTRHAVFNGTNPRENYWDYLGIGDAGEILTHTVLGHAAIPID